MSNSCGSPEDVVKQRGRDGKMRREDVDDSQPEGKRLKLGNEEGNIGKDRGAPVPEGGGEGKSDYKSDVMTLVSSAKNSPHGPVSRSILLNRLDSVTYFRSSFVLFQSSVTGTNFYLSVACKTKVFTRVIPPFASKLSRTGPRTTTLYWLKG
uniref:Uncharacterized protein n=1 Tax=Buteo japonicus TaxID=224669 RepID=A0A8C0AVP3_9AVES